jgi:hypothetical protein
MPRRSLGINRAYARGLLVVAAALTVAACADRNTTFAPTAPGDARVAAGQSAASTDDLVFTPHGWYHRDCVHTVPDGAHIHQNGQVTTPDGATFSMPTCAHPGRVAVSAHGISEPPEDNGWMESAGYDVGTAWGQISASWHVPAAPVPQYGVVSDSEQVFYSFPALEPLSGASILQPVLTYGTSMGYGGNFWTATSWYCKSLCEHSSTVLSVSPGDSLVGSVTASGCSDGMCTWTVVTVDVRTGGRSSLLVQDSSAYLQAFGGAMEVYHLNSCPYYPAAGVFFTGISLYDQSNHQVTPLWNKNVTAGTSPACGLSVNETSSTVGLNDDPGPSIIMSGPNTGQPGARVTVTATVSSGATPYTYSWKIVDGSGSCGNSNSCSGNLSTNGGSITTFQVSVTDHDDVAAGAEWGVTVCSGAPSDGPPPPKC